MAQVQTSIPALSLRDTRLDFNKFPRLFSEWLISESERRVCDPHLVLPYLLSTVSAFSGYSQVTLPTGWVINICTWAVAVGESGCNKSGAHDFVRDAAFEVFQAFVKDEVWVCVAGRERERKRESNVWQLPPYSKGWQWQNWEGCQRNPSNNLRRMHNGKKASDFEDKLWLLLCWRCWGLVMCSRCYKIRLTVCVVL